MRTKEKKRRFSFILVNFKMRLCQSLLLCAIRPFIWPSKTLAATVPLVTRDVQNETRTGDKNDTHQDPNSSGTGLSSDSVNVDSFDWVKGIDKNPTAWQDELLEPDHFAKIVLEWPGDVTCGVAYNGCNRKSLGDDISERIGNMANVRQVCYIFELIWLIVTFADT